MIPQGSLVNRNIDWTPTLPPPQRSFNVARFLRLSAKFYAAVALAVILAMLSLTLPYLAISIIRHDREMQTRLERTDQMRLDNLGRLQADMLEPTSRHARR